MSELLTEFRKTFLFERSFNKFKDQFVALSPIYQKAIIALCQGGMPADDAFNYLKGVDQEKLLLQFDETLSALFDERRGDLTW